MASNSIVYLLLGIIIALVIIFGILILLAEKNESDTENKEIDAEKNETACNCKQPPEHQTLTSITFSNATYFVNSTAAVNVTDPTENTDVNIRGNITVTVSSTSDKTGIQLELQQPIKGKAKFVTHPYKLILTSLNSNQKIDALQVSAGDIITAEYHGYTTTAQVIAPPSSPTLGFSLQDPTVSIVNGQGGPLGSFGVNINYPGTNVAIPACYGDTWNSGICDEWIDDTTPNPNYMGTITSGPVRNELAIPYPNDGSGVVYQLQCNPNIPYDCPRMDMPNIYVELHYMDDPKNQFNQSLTDTAISAVQQAFLNNKNQPIDLHVIKVNDVPSGGIGYYNDVLTVPGSSDGTTPNSYFAIKQAFFGNSTDRVCDPQAFTGELGFQYKPQCTDLPGATSTTIQNWLAAKRQVFHFALAIHQQDKPYYESSGWAEIFGNDIVISLGAFSPNENQPLPYTTSTVYAGTNQEQEGTFMHELGHNLDLGHGGPVLIAGSYQPDNSVNCKPNYMSVMNYLYQTPWVVPHGLFTLDYSENKYSDLLESGLNENSGIGTAMKPYSVAFGYTKTTPTGPIISGTVGPLPGPPPAPSSSPQMPIDWNQDGTMENNVNSDVDNLNIPDCNTASTTDSLYSHTDWPNLRLDFYNSVNYLNGATTPYPPTPQNELTRAELDQMILKFWHVDTFGKNIPMVLNETSNGTGTWSNP